MCAGKKHAVSDGGNYCMRQTICFAQVAARQYLSGLVY